LSASFGLAIRGHNRIVRPNWPAHLELLQSWHSWRLMAARPDHEHVDHAERPDHEDPEDDHRA
jgi:hypothetical protein